MAQVDTGAVSGYVLDPSGKAIPNAAVGIDSVARSYARSARSSISGYYEFDGLPPAEYRLSVNASAFAPLTTATFPVEVDRRVRLDFHPSIAGQGTQVVVKAEIPAIQTDSSELGAVLDQTLVDNLPLNERDFLQLALLLPGVAPPVEGSQLSTRGTFSMDANGAREEANNFLLDGVDNNDSDTRGYVLEPSVDSIQEFKIATNSYSAEYGSASAAQVNIVTRGGTNQFRGTVYDYLRNRDLDARNYFDGSTKPEFTRNQFGASLGGPVIRNSTFFYGNYEGLREDEAETQLGIVPSDAIRSEATSPLVKDVLSLYPLPNLSGNSLNYLGNPIGTDSQNEGSVRLDQRISNKSQLTLRYNYGRRNLFEPYTETEDQAEPPVPGFGDFVFDRGHNALAHYEQTLSSTTVNSVLLGFNRAIRQILVQNYATNVNALWGVGFMPTDTRDYGFPGISVSGYSNVGDVASLPIDRADNTYQLADNLTMIRGAHSIKVGGEVRDLQENGYIEVYSRGQMYFTGALTGSAIGDLLQGLPTYSIKSQYTGPQTLRSKSAAAYFQDDWKVSRNLTLNLGLRYEYDAPATDPTNRMATFDFATGRTAQVGTNEISRSGTHGWAPGYNPRVGFAWSPMNHTVIRGGYGIYYDPGMFDVNSSLYFNPPFFTVSVYGGTTLSDPFAATNGFAPPAALSFISPDFKPSYTQHWNFNIQQEVDRVGVFSIAYAGAKGTDLPRSLDINQPLPSANPIAPYPTYSNMDEIESGGNSEYQSLQASLKRRLANGLAVLASYTRSKSIDDTSAFLPTSPDQNFPQDSHDYRLNRGLSSYDVPNLTTVGLVYDIPSAWRWARGFQLSAIIAAESGQPFTPVLDADNSNTGNGGIPTNFGLDRPNVLFNPVLSNPTPQEWFNVHAFAIPPQYTWGDAGRNILRGPNLRTADLSLRRTFVLRERLRLTAEAQAFNTLNRANFNLPSAIADNPLTFGEISSAKDPRQIQFALRLGF